MSLELKFLLEHLFGLGIDNVLIEIDNEELILDGSAKVFIEKKLQQE